MKKEAYTIAINGVEKETEKAALISFCVSWNSNCHTRSFWVPRSQFSWDVEGKVINLAKWYADKLSKENAFKTYGMRFEGMFEGLKEL